MLPLDYETPVRPTRSTKEWHFYVAFILAYLPGVIILGIVDEVIHWLSGHYGNAGVMPASLFISPFVLANAVIIKRILPRYRTVSFAIASAILMPLLLYLVWVATSL